VLHGGVESNIHAERALGILPTVGGTVFANGCQGVTTRDTIPNINRDKLP
jgi:hypothetical protein